MNTITAKKHAIFFLVFIFQIQNSNSRQHPLYIDDLQDMKYEVRA